jgi:hypothetical protein
MIRYNCSVLVSVSVYKLMEIAFIEYMKSKFYRLGIFRAAGFAGDDVVGLFTDAGAGASANLFDHRARFAAGEVWQRPSKHEYLTSEFTVACINTSRLEIEAIAAQAVNQSDMVWFGEPCMQALSHDRADTVDFFELFFCGTGNRIE